MCLYLKIATYLKKPNVPNFKPKLQIGSRLSVFLILLFYTKCVCFMCIYFNIYIHFNLI